MNHSTIFSAAQKASIIALLAAHEPDVVKPLAHCTGYKYDSAPALQCCTQMPQGRLLTGDLRHCRHPNGDSYLSR